MAAANEWRTNAMAAAATPPAITGPQWIYESGPPGVTRTGSSATDAAGTTGSSVGDITVSFGASAAHLLWRLSGADQRKPKNDRIARITTIKPTR